MWCNTTLAFHGIGAAYRSDSTVNPLPAHDTNYIKSYYDKLSITAISKLKNNQFSIYNYINGEDITFSTNKLVTYGLAIDYKWVTLELAYPIKVLSPGNPNLGKTKGVELSFGLNKRKWWFRTFYEYNKGYYAVNNPYDPHGTKGEEHLRPDIRNEIFFASMYYGFNHRKFSYLSALWQIEKQKKSASSFTAGLTVARNKISADSSLIPLILLDGDSISQPFETSLNNYYVLNAGAVGTLVFARHFFITGTFVPGQSFLHGHWHDVGGRRYKKPMTLGLALEFKFGGGYVGDRFSAGFNMLTTKIISYEKANNLEYSQSYTPFRVFLGSSFILTHHKILSAFSNFN